MKRILFLAAVALMAAATALAVPAMPGLLTVVQSDGTTLQVQLLGDERFHCLITADGLTVAQADDGDYYYQSAIGITQVRAHDAAQRTPTELTFLTRNAGRFTMQALMEQAQRTGTMRCKASEPRHIDEPPISQVPTLGSPRVPIILVQYSDKKMSNSLDDFEAQYKTSEKCVLQYFIDQSNGKYTPQFDLYGIYNLSGNRYSYGHNVKGLDAGVARMTQEAITLAGDEIDWSQYDNDGDGQADVCIVVYAGVGEAQSGIGATVWPCQWDFTNAKEYNDGTGPMTRNGVTIDKFAVFNEIGGSSDTSTVLDGIGTFCHEFSHCLGLPDFYETTYKYRYFGMNVWSLMDKGCYNGGAVRGDTPIGYSAYEKMYMGWIDPIEPRNDTQYTLPVFNSGNADDDVALKVTALNKNEYYMIENRRKQGWDLYIPAEGVLITHFTYLPKRWYDNTVNDSAVQLATIVPADNSLNTYNVNNDTYGPTNHNLNALSTPPLRANMFADGVLATTPGGAGPIDKPITEIYLVDDGTATLWYCKGYPVIQPGDVNADGEVGVDDLNILVNIVLDLDNAANYDDRAYITGETTVSITDINALINIILNQ